ncbi:DUF4017 family protein [Paraclostridium dentum]|uniref:DUF4017 family protein n=1 Tax=Paraclostridium dentum TaxID=2662455 RepID=UPI003F3C60A1
MLKTIVVLINLLCQRSYSYTPPTEPIGWKWNIGQVYTIPVLVISNTNELCLLWFLL